MTIRSLQSLVYSAPTTPGATNANNIGLDGKDPTTQFLNMLVGEIQNQDPDHPVDDVQMITQFAQIQAAVGLNNLSSATQMFQRVQTASNLIGQTITVKDPTTRERVSGKVDSIDFSGPMPVISIGGQAYPLDAVQAVGA